MQVLGGRVLFASQIDDALCWVDPENFRRIVVHLSMMEHHMPWNYGRALDSWLASYGLTAAGPIANSDEPAAEHDEAHVLRSRLAQEQLRRLAADADAEAHNAQADNLDAEITALRDSVTKWEAENC